MEDGGGAGGNGVRAAKAKGLRELKLERKINSESTEGTSSTTGRRPSSKKEKATFGAVQYEKKKENASRRRPLPTQNPSGEEMGSKGS